RRAQRKLIQNLVERNSTLAQDSAIVKWQSMTTPFPEPFPVEGQLLPCKRESAAPAWIARILDLASAAGVRVPNMYGYARAYSKHPEWNAGEVTVLDPTAGGGSIPFEALRLGCNVVANDLNPVSAVILHATLEYPVRYGVGLTSDIAKWGQNLLSRLDQELDD